VAQPGMYPSFDLKKCVGSLRVGDPVEIKIDTEVDTRRTEVLRKYRQLRVTLEGILLRNNFIVGVV